MLAVSNRLTLSHTVFVGSLWEAKGPHMARTIRNQKIDSRSARAKLPPKKSGYWATVAPGCSLGYRKGATGGAWLAKYVRDSLRKETTIGPADDAMDANGVTAIDYADAQARARAWFETIAKQASATEEPEEPLTVDRALDDYLADYTRRGGKSLKDTSARAAAFIRPELGARLISSLTAKQLRDWHAGLAAAGARLRSAKGETEHKTWTLDPTDPEALRRRRATANRTLTILKAALNHAFREGKASSDLAWRRVQPFREADSAKIRYLSESEITRLANATNPDFRPMVAAALLTGCRYGELAALQVCDFDRKAETLLIRTSKSGKARRVFLDDDGVTFLEQHTAGKPGDALIFARPDGSRWGKSHQHRPLREACKAGKINPAVSFHILRHTYASLRVMRGVPLQVLAGNLGHADTRMTEKHYAHLADSYARDMLRNGAPKLGLVTDGKVTPIGRKRAAARARVAHPEKAKKTA